MTQKEYTNSIVLSHSLKLIRKSLFLLIVSLQKLSSCMSTDLQFSHFYLLHSRNKQVYCSKLYNYKNKNVYLINIKS